MAAEVFDDVVAEDGETGKTAINEMVAAAREYITDHDQFADQLRPCLEALVTVDGTKPRNPLHPTDEPGMPARN